MDNENIVALINTIKQKNPKKIMLQLPEGLKRKAIEITKLLEKEGIDTIISGDSCYGACDLKDREAIMSDCDLLVHVGHSEFMKYSELPVLYFTWPFNKEIKLPEKEIDKIKENSISLITTIQHLHVLEYIKKQLENKGKKIEIIGQVLGCSKIETKSDAILFIGSGEFHPSRFRGNVYVYNIESNIISDISEKLFILEKKKQAALHKIKEAENIAILVSSKKGQFNIKAAQEIRNKIIKQNKKAFIILMDEIRGEKLEGLGFNGFVNTACPRISEDKFPGPIVNYEDLID